MEDSLTPAVRPKLTVAITGPTGDIGRSLLRRLERSEEVGEIRAMAGGRSIRPSTG